ncbi:MAG TPA: hypothetical protein PKD46_12225 [Aggregatilineaceae bacterium]|jgi:hypothetical protein|nr:hypothetical protein [Anaerolineae bacterium]HMM29040.1 hypothetical protein [Aggregatilineaceae bacterium]
MQHSQPRHPLYSVAWFEDLFDALDRLHDDVCGLGSGALDDPSALDAEAMAGWLEDIVYTAQETIAELRAIAPAARGSRRELSG